MFFSLATGQLALLLFAQLPMIEAQGFPESVQKDTLLATVRIINPKKNTLGVGVLVANTDRLAYLLTAGHVVENTDEVEVHFFDGKSYPKPSKIYKSVPVYARGKDLQPDLAVLKLVGFDGEQKALKICSLKTLPRGSKFTALGSACGEKLAPTLRQLNVQEVIRAKRPNEHRVGTYFRTKEKTVGGQSGGPLVDSRSQLMGICSGANAQQGYFCHVEEIHAFLVANDLGFLVKEKP